MSDNVTPLRPSGASVFPLGPALASEGVSAGRPPNLWVIDVLEELLIEARAGRLRWLAYAGVSAPSDVDGGVLTVSGYGGDRDAQMINIGYYGSVAIARLKARHDQTFLTGS